MVEKRGAEQGGVRQRPAVQEQGKADEAHGVIGVFARERVVIDANMPSDLFERAPETLERDRKARFFLAMVRQIVDRPHHAFEISIVFEEFVLFEFLIEKENDFALRQVLFGALRPKAPLVHERRC